MTAEPILAAGARVSWRRVALFYGIALVGPVLGAALLLLGASIEEPLYAVAIITMAMVFPLIAGLLTERVAGCRTLLSREWAALRAAVGRTIGRVVGFSAIAFAVIMAAQLLVAWLGAPVPGAGRYASPDELASTLSDLGAVGSPPVAAAALIAATAVQAFIAGLTINGVFAFGEEYGWRGVLAEELRPLGVVRANLFTGVIWGLWHAPLIALGHNYQEQWAIGIPLFVLIATPLSFVLWWARARSGSVAAAAVVHGAFNGFVGVFLLVLVGADRIVAVPVGVLGSVALTLAAVLLWRIPGLRPAPSA